MPSPLLPRLFSLCLAVVVSLTLLLGIRGLSAHEQASARLAMSMCPVTTAS